MLLFYGHIILSVYNVYTIIYINPLAERRFSRVGGIFLIDLLCISKSPFVGEKKENHQVSYKGKSAVIFLQRYFI